MFAKILVDVIIALIVIAGAVLGIKRGFLISVARPIKWFAALFIAFSLCTPIAQGIIKPFIEAPITNQISGYLTERCADITAENAGEKLPTVLKLAAELADVNINSIEGESSKEIINALVDKLADPVISLISTIAAFILVYILAKLLLSIAIKLLNSIFEHGVLGVLNRTLGFAFGLIFSFMCAWIFVIVFGYVISIPAIADVGWVESFEGGVIYRLFKNISPLDLLFSF